MIEQASLAPNFLDLLTKTCDGLEEHLKTSTRTLLMLMEDHQRMEETRTWINQSLTRALELIWCLFSWIILEVEDQRRVCLYVVFVVNDQDGGGSVFIWYWGGDELGES